MLCCGESRNRTWVLVGEGAKVGGDEHTLHQQEFLKDPTMPAHRSRDTARSCGVDITPGQAIEPRSMMICQ